MFEKFGRWFDGLFVGFRNWLDVRLVPTWRVWWKLWSMRLGLVVAALATYLTAVPRALLDALNMLPPWLHDSIPTWIGPVTMALLFFARFWDQSQAVVPQAVPPKDPQHGAE